MRAHRLIRRQQQGAIAIVFGLTLAVLLTMGGFVIDLGHLYIAKTELQNGADAAALAGAKDLNETTAGVTNAFDQAQKVALKNQYNFSSNIVLTDITFGPSPDGPWSSLADAQASPNSKTFVRVDTGSKTIDTYLMRVAGINTTNTSGVAVAGRFVNDITPIGICAIDPAHQTASYSYTGPPAITEIVEYGFRRGVAYNLFDLNPLSGGPSDPYLINPVDAPPAACQASHSSTSFTAPFMCNGSTAVLASGSGQVYTNTGLGASLAASLNSRFDDYSGPSVCDPVTAPPDSNIKEYPCKGGGTGCAATSVPSNWMEPAGATLPSREDLLLSGANSRYQLPPLMPAAAGFAQFASYGVLWAYGPAYQSNGGSPAAVAAAITPAQANLNPLYNSSAVSYFDTSVSGYPTVAGSGFPAGTPAAPYNQTSGAYFQAPPVHPPGARNRRILNVVLIDCTIAAVGPASCARMTTVGVGKFFMLEKADFSGGSKHLDIEFAGLIEPVPTSEIKLYR